MPEHLLGVRGLRYRYPNTVQHALAGVDLHVAPGECVALLGESGCGKSTLARIVAGLQPPTSGEVVLAGRPVHRLPPRVRARLVQIVFQDSLAALDPHLPVGVSIGLGLPPAERRLAVRDLLASVGLPAATATALPHELSGGQRQRACIARALSMRPQLLVADEPLSSLDVSVQAQILHLLTGLRRELGLSMLFITHDPGVATHLADRVVILHRGLIVETGPASGVLTRPTHPVTRALVAGVPLGPEDADGGVANA